MKHLMILLICMLPVFSYAGQAKDMAADPVLEKRMIGLAENLRCLVCQNESLASSHADLAEDLRREVREQMHNGMNDQEIIDYLVSRYGDFVLYDPPVKKSTLVLWFGPFALLLAGVGMLVYQLRKRKSRISEIVLSDEDVQRAAELLNETHTRNPPLHHLDSLGKTTSHSTRPQTTAAKSLVIPQPGDGAIESLREFHVKDPQA